MKSSYDINYRAGWMQPTIDAEELDELRDLGVVIPQRVNRAETVRKTLQRHIDKLESFTKKNI